MAKPIKDRVPLTATWNSIKAGNDTLKKSPMFKPEILGPIGKYDQALLGYTKQLTDKDKLSDLLKDVSKAFHANEGESKKYQAERDKIDADTGAKGTKAYDEIQKFAGDPDADTNAASLSVTNFCAAFEDNATLHRALSEKVFGINKQRIAALNKIRDDYKAKAAAIAANMAKFEKDVLTLEVQIRGIINTYAKIAIDMNHSDAADDARGLLEKF